MDGLLRRANQEHTPSGKPAYMRIQRQTVKQPFSPTVRSLRPLRGALLSDSLIQELIPVVPAPRFIAGIADQFLDVFLGQPEAGAGRTDDILLHHDGSEIVRSVLQR